MIPLTLQLKNFLSYGSTIQTIDFTPYKLICLSGKNGHGKSALLDALTWVIWGQARKIGSNAKADHGVLRLGQVEMMVCLDFMFNNQTYRIKRDYSKKYGKPHLHVEFGLLDKDDAHFISLTDKTVRKTQEKIEKTLGLDYDTFINSSFLRQGQANEFSKKSSKERKEVLSTILGLHHYDATKKYILEESKKVAQEKNHLERLKERISEQLETVASLPEKQKEIEQKIKEFQKQSEKFTLTLKKVETEQKIIAKKTQDSSLLQFKLSEKKEHITNQREQLISVASEWKKTHKALLLLPDKDLLKKEEEQLKSITTEQQKQFEKSLELKEQILKKRETFNKIKSDLDKQHHELHKEKEVTLERLKVEAEIAQKKEPLLYEKLKTIEDQTATLTKQIAELRATLSPDALVTDNKEFQSMFERKKNLYQKWVEQGNWVNNELKSLTQKQLLSQDQTKPSCPLCEQNLSQSRKKFLYKKFCDQESFLLHRFNRIKKYLERIKITLKKQHQELATLSEIQNLIQKEKEHKKENQKTNQELILLKKELLEKKEAFESHQKEFLTLKNSQAHESLKKSDYQKLETELQLLEKEFLNIKYDQSEHKKNILALRTIESQLLQYSDTENQQALQTERKKNVHKLCKNLQGLTKEYKTHETDFSEFKNLEKETKSLQEKITDFQSAKKVFEAEKEQIVHQKGHIESEEKKRQQLILEQKKCEKTLKELTLTLHEYQIMVKTFGKDGIQALLIEDAIPEIEQEANELLAKLTDNQASIHIESLRDLKKGGTKETLDINISDATGIRPYELFSGGEAFRIDFSLRIAISKLLARRAGTSLQTLIIDEGFGSQDEEGLQHIMDALYSIQSSFEKIIIVSHLTTMKDQFPVHFIIHKDPQGSKVTVFEQG